MSMKPRTLSVCQDTARVRSGSVRQSSLCSRAPETENNSPDSLCDTGSCAQCPERTGQEVAGPHDRPTRHPDQEIIRSGSATFSFHTAAVSEPTSLYYLSALDARSFRNNLGCAKLRRGSAGRRLLNERDGMGTSTRPEVYESGMRGLAHSKHRGRQAK